MSSSLRIEIGPTPPEATACQPRAASIAALAASPRSDAPDRIDRSLPQGDVYFNWAQDAGWNAFFEGKQEGFPTGRGPKAPEQMAHAVQSTLQRLADAGGVPIDYRASKEGDGFRVSGRDANRSGADVDVRADGSVLVSTTQDGVENRLLRDELMWFPENHDTGRLEHRSPTWPAGAWLPDAHVTPMTGGER